MPNPTKRKMMSLDNKLKIIAKLEAGENASAIGRAFGINESTVRTIRSKKEDIKSSVQHSKPLAAKKLKYARHPLLMRMESMLVTWIEDNNQKHIPVDGNIIRQKALNILQHLQDENEVLEFSASKGWFDKFRMRYNFHNIKFTGESASADQISANQYPAELLNLIQAEGYLPKQVFNADETGLYWKRMPNRTFISKDEAKTPGFKVSKDRLTLLFCGNAEGDFKCKPLLIYKSENPRALKNVNKANLPILWRFNRRAWMTGKIFDDWFMKDFCPEVKRYCKSQNLQFKALLLIDNAPSHLEHLQIMHDKVKVVFLPPNTTSLIQPMDQGVISTFKSMYLKNTFKAMLDATENPSMTLKEFWKSYTIFDALNNINSAWNDIKKSTINACWKKLWPECIHLQEQEVAGNTRNLTDLVELGRRIGGEGFEDLQIDDIQQLLNTHEEALSVEELIECVINKEEEKESEQKSESINLLNISNLQKGLRMFEDIDFLQNLDNDCVRGGLMFRNISSALAPYHFMLFELKKNARQPTILEFFRQPKIVLESEQPGTSSNDV